VYTVAERVFNPNLKEKEKILAFDRYWDGYDLKGGSGKGQAQMYWYEAAPLEWQPMLSELAKNAYLACEGEGYGRG
jgi:hypothetical protein